MIFTSDNGPARAAGPVQLSLMHDAATGAGFGVGGAKGVTGGRKGYKGALFEGGIGVPFIARWPGEIAAGKVDKTSLISAVDLLPTFCEIAGVELPSKYMPDGLSQVTTLKGKAKTQRDKPLFWKMDAPWPVQKSRPDHWVAYAVVAQNWKMVTNKDSSHIELYNITSDPFEKTDHKKTKPAVVARMSKLLTDWKATLPSGPDKKCFSKERTQ